MNSLRTDPAGFCSFGVNTLEGAEAYYRLLQNEYFTGVPGVNLSAECAGLLAPLLEDFRAEEPHEFAQLWMFQWPSGAAFLTTHLHQDRPGVAFSEFLQARLIPDDLQTFVLKWRKMVGAYYALVRLYMLSDPHEPIFAPDQQIVGRN
jgi:hypothetical protein